MDLWRLVIALLALFTMIGVCFFVSGISTFSGTIFERKTTVGKK